VPNPEAGEASMLRIVNRSARDEARDLDFPSDFTSDRSGIL